MGILALKNDRLVIKNNKEIKAQDKKSRIRRKSKIRLKDVKMLSLWFISATDRIETTSQSSEVFCPNDIHVQYF